MPLLSECELSLPTKKWRVDPLDVSMTGDDYGSHASSPVSVGSEKALPFNWRRGPAEAKAWQESSADWRSS